jgi:uncharacterized protein (DUF362 family)
MDHLTRRQVLQYLLSGTAAIASSSVLSACQSKTQVPTTAPASIPPASNASTDVPVSTAIPAVSQPTPTTVTYPDLVVTRTGEPEALVRAAIDGIGGLGRFVHKNNWVIIKPNICIAYYGYEYATTTNPWVVGAMVKLCFEAGASKVQVMDFPFGGSASSAYQVSGIAEQVQAAGGEMVQMADFMFKTTTIENALSLRESRIYEDVFKADALINIPIAKTHGMATLTMGMKNLMGLIHDREEIHWAFGKRLTDLSMKIKPVLTVIDAVRILVNNGPTGGSLDDVRKLDTVIVSPDIVAADSYGATLFGKSPEDLDYVKTASSVGFGKSDLTKMYIKEITLGA